MQAQPDSTISHLKPAATSHQSLLLIIIGSVVILLVAIGVLLLTLGYGATLVAPIAATPTTIAATVAKSKPLLSLLIALIAVIVTGLALSKLFAYLGQPPVIGEVVAGIVLGPSLLGTELSAYLLPPDVAPYLGMIAQLGVLLYMFTVGLELHIDVIRQRAHTTLVTAQASIALPFVLGALLALILYPRLAIQGVAFTSFALFLGVALSITAFPVLARILTDRGLHKTDLGILALSCAAIGDVVAWCLLALVVGVAQTQIREAVVVIGWTLLYLAGMLLVVRPLLARALARWERAPLQRPLVALVFAALLLSSLVTEIIGIHAIFGAFLLGALIPQESVVARTFPHQLGSVVAVLLLPAFFAFTGMRTRIDLVAGWEAWLLCGLIILVAIAGKLIGTALPARYTGLGWRPALALGALMNTRGLMELIVLNIGLDLGIISPTLFAMMVIMALVTTMMTGPLLRWIMPDFGR